MEGRILDMPAELRGQRLQNRTAAAFPVREQGSIIWMYMGPPEKQPPFPAFDWTAVPEANVVISKMHTEANFIQVIEGTITPLTPRSCTPKRSTT